MRPRDRRVSSIDRNGQTRRHRPDYTLIIISLILMTLGLMVIYSISPGLAAQRGVSDNYYVSKQLIAIVLGFIVFGIMATVPLSFWQRARKPLIVAAAVATLIALIMPVSTLYPAHRWIRFGGLSFQSVELIKFAMLFVLSGFLVDRLKRGELSSSQKTFKPLIIGLVVVGFIVAKLQSDLGSVGVMVAMLIAMAFVVGLPLKRALLIGGIILVGAVMLISTSAYRRDRLLTFMHPEQDCLTTGYQACQALIAVGSGGLFGKGLANSVQAYGYLPEAANDSIFAIFAEKFGFVGAAVLVALFIAFFTRLVRIMERAPDDGSRLIVAGVLAWLSTQTIINVGAMIGLLPLKGITLPLISYGGTSIIFVTGVIGLVFNISRYTTYAPNADTAEGRTNDNRLDGRRDRRAYYAPLGRRA
jgi:cell division protein FtsW